MTSAIPQGYTSVTPCLILKDCEKAIETYKKGLSAKELSKMMCPVTGKVMHAELQIGNARIMVQDEFPGQKSTTSSIFVYNEDCDAAMKKAKDAGLKEIMPTEDMFWGDRMGCVTDSNGNQWTLATHIEDKSQEEIEKAAKEWAEKMAKGQKAA